MTVVFITQPVLVSPDALDNIHDLRRALANANGQIEALHKVIQELASQIGPILIAHMEGDGSAVFKALEAFVATRVVTGQKQGEVH